MEILVLPLSTSGNGWTKTSLRPASVRLNATHSPVGETVGSLTPPGMQGTLSGARAESVTTVGCMSGRIDQLEVTTVRGFEGGMSPFFAPDGDRRGFYDRVNDTLKTISVQGGTVFPTGYVGRPPWGASWGPDDGIIVRLSCPLGPVRTSSVRDGQQGFPDVGGTIVEHVGERRARRLERRDRRACPRGQLGGDGRGVRAAVSLAPTRDGLGRQTALLAWPGARRRPGSRRSSPSTPRTCPPEALFDNHSPRWRSSASARWDTNSGDRPLTGRSYSWAGTWTARSDWTQTMHSLAATKF